MARTATQRRFRTTTRGLLRGALLATALLAAALPGAGVPAAAAQEVGARRGSDAVAVIVHADVPARTLSHADLLDLYLGDVRFWDDGTEVVLLDQQATTDVKRAFYEGLGRSVSRMKSLWLRRRLAGEGDPPEALASDAAVIERVAATPGAVGFVRADRVRGRPGVRVVRLLPIGG